MIVNAPATITASSDTKAIGVLIGESGSVEFNDALTVTSNSKTESIGLSLTDVTSSVAFNKGDSLIKAEKALESTGVVDIASAAKVTFDGSISLAEDGAINVADKAQLMVKNSVESTIAGQINSGDALTGEIAFAGGEMTLTETAKINANTLKLSDIEVHNRGKVEIADSIHLGSGAIWNDYDDASSHAATFYLGEGSEYVWNDVNDFGSTFMIDDNQALYLQGGHVYTIDRDGVKTAYKNILASEENSNTYIEGAYAYDNVTVNHETAKLVVQSEKGQLTVDRLEVLNGHFAVLNGAKVTANELDLQKNITIADGGVLTTFTDQIFTVGLNEEGSTLSAEALNANGENITISGGTLAFNDAFYNDNYKASVRELFGQGKDLVFNGTLYTPPPVDPDVPSVDPDVPPVDPDATVQKDIADMEDDAYTFESNVEVMVGANDSDSTQATIDKSFGVSSIQVSEGVESVEINSGKKVTLVGGEGKELVSFDAENPQVIVSGELQVGKEGSSGTSGTLSATLTINGDDASLTVSAGEYTFAKVEVDNGQINIEKGKATFDDVTLNAGTEMHNAGEAVVTNLSFSSAGTVAMTGAFDITNLQGNAETTLEIGTNDKRGDLTLGENSKLNGMTLFLDPAWVDGQTVADASRLIYQNTTVDGKIVVGHNSYVVLGGDSDAELRAVFDKQLTWGDTGALAAAYVAKPITINSTNGALYVDSSLTSVPGSVVTGSVVFGDQSVLVANVTDLTSGALITADSFDVSSDSKAVIVGTMQQNVDYQLTDGNGTVWGSDQIVSGNALWKLEHNADGTFSVKLQDASLIYGDLMQGAEIANGGMLAGGAAEDYVNDLLTDTSGNISALPSVAARFDAAMNPAGALATFTTAYDRANDLRQVVRDESVIADGTRLWARVTGSDNSMTDLTTGAQSIEVDTSAYGLVIGGETTTGMTTVGMAVTAGSGDSENDAVAAKNDFNYYGLSVYGKTMVGSVEVLADASVTMVKNDMMVGGVADVEAEADTMVYSMGIQAQKTFELESMTVTPFVGLDVYHVDADGYSNGHGATVDSASATAVEMPIGLTIAKGFETAGGMKVDPSFTFAVVPTLGGSDIDSKVKFAGAESTYNFTFADDVKVRSNFGVEASKKNFYFGVSAGYEWGSEGRSTTSINANVKYMF